jgi:hypothetical protein
VSLPVNYYLLSIEHRREAESECDSACSVREKAALRLPERQRSDQQIIALGEKSR